MKTELNVICDIAEQMLKSGAETYRVEDSLYRMCIAIGAKRADVFIITSSIVVTVYLENERAYTQTRRINSIDTNMEKLHRLNAFCRKICNGGIPLEKLKEEYVSAVNIPSYPLWLEFLSYGFIGLCFCAFFGGGLVEALLSFVVGTTLRLIVLVCDKFTIGKIFTRFSCSFVATLLAYLFYSLKFISTPDFIIIGNIMVLIPGIGLTNALCDLFAGDSIAGILRFIEAILIALSIAAGYFLFVTFFKGVLI